MPPVLCGKKFTTSALALSYSSWVINLFSSIFAKTRFFLSSSLLLFFPLGERVVGEFGIAARYAASARVRPWASFPKYVFEASSTP